MVFGTSLMQRWVNDAKVATKKAEITNNPSDWYDAASAWRKAEYPDKADYCEKMAKMLEGLN